MGFTVRSLLARIKPNRPDISDDGTIVYVAQEVARRLMKDCVLGQVTQDVVCVPAGTSEVLLTSSLPWWDSTNLTLTSVEFDDKLVIPSAAMTVTSSVNPNAVATTDGLQNKEPVDVHRVLRVRAYRPSVPGVFQKYYRMAADIDPDPTTMRYAVGDFMIALAAGTVTLTTGVVVTWNAGDIIYSQGTTWAVEPRTNFSTLKQESQGIVDKFYQRPQSATGNPSAWTSKYDQIGFNTITTGIAIKAYSGTAVYLYPRPENDIAIEFTYSTIPTGDMADLELNLPPEARDCIVAGTLAELLLYPGQHQNTPLAQLKAIEFERLKAPLTCMGVFGAGSTTYKPPVFARNRFSGNGFFS